MARDTNRACGGLFKQIPRSSRPRLVWLWQSSTIGEYTQPPRVQIMGDVSVRVAFETARLRLSHILAEGQEARQTAYRSACEHSARTLGVERVGIWFLSERGDSLSRVLQYTLSTNTFHQSGEIHRKGAERYFEALLSRRVVAAADAVRDPRTSQLESYLLKERVTALLDAPIYRDGHVIGVVCHEHVGGVRDWTEREAGFASAVADLLTI